MDKKIFGFHSVFYYYGKDHLLINMKKYIEEGIENNELISIFIEPSYEENFKDIFTIEQLEYIEFINIIDFIAINREQGIVGFSKKLSDYVHKAESKNFQGVRFIGQPTYAIELTCEKDFMLIEDNFSEAIKDINMSIMCIYDFEDFLNEKKYINEKIIEQAEHTHDHRMYLKNIYLA